MWKARVVQWQNAGISVTSMTPTEGALAYVSGFVIPKNSPNKEGAYAYLDAMLDKSAQEAFAVDMGYNPTVSNAVVAPDLNKRIGFTPDEIKKLVDLDYNYLNKNDFQSDERPTSLLSATTLVGPATVFVAAGLLVPLAILFRYSFDKVDARRIMIETFSFDNYVKFFSDPYYTGVLATTLRVAALCTVVCLAMGLPLAYVLARTQSRFKNVLIMLVVLPLFVGNAVRAAGWMTLFGSKGFLNVTLMQLGIITQPLQIMFTEGAVIAGIIAVNLPYMVLTLQSVIEGINRNVEEAAFSLGAGPATMFRRVLLPLSLPGILAGTILTFILGMNAYATPVLLGGPKFKMMGPLVYGQFQLNNWPFGASVAFVLMTATLTLTATANILIQRRFRR
jgi:putative spermidine/putrescine transport system permease protein